RVRERFAARLTGDLSHQLDVTADPADWWARELPYQLERGLSGLDQQVRVTLQQRVAENARILAEQLSSRFGVQPEQLTGVRVPEPAAPDISPRRGSGGQLTSLHRRRILYRVAPPGVALLAVLLLP